MKIIHLSGWGDGEMGKLGGLGRRLLGVLIGGLTRPYGGWGGIFHLRRRSPQDEVVGAGFTQT
ncbi:MAG: hypothetical protein J7545_05870 [Roseofilum sp. SBFL]|uniref:hypothetical protein n=1 Tax=Roseofilum sp. SBFL TaxID=2821496 RepID=UPI001B017635|nr:hypothetical protein [Roseofilum sp. SBFL]MBP0041489.1 hypothetical protein [Roseofilum sp. SBFL]